MRLNKQFKRYLINKFEVAEHKKYIDITYILASSVDNFNGALVTKEEMELAKDSIIHQPLIIVPDWDNLPTGHSLAEFPKLDWDALIIGTHIDSSIMEDENGVSHLTTTARVWKIRFPEVAGTMVGLFESGNLKFSMEASFESQTIEGATRTLHGVEFIGSAVVDDPANPFSFALEVANKRKQKEEKVVNFEEAMKKLEELDAEAHKLVKAEYDTVKASLDTAEATQQTLKDSLETANNEVTTLKTEIATMKDDQEKKELAAKQDERVSEYAKYVELSDDELAAKKDVFGKMDDDTWNLVLETAKANKKEDKKENHSLASNVKVDLENNNFLSFLDKKE